MPEIKYICLSDLHLGADNSLLTYVRPDTSEVDPTQPSDTLLKLVGCLRNLILSNHQASRPTLVLNGDVLELALALDNKAVMAFERFLELGEFAASNEWATARKRLYKAIKKVEWPTGSGKFTIYPESGKKRGMGNGVVPIKAGLMLDLEKQCLARIPRVGRTGSGELPRIAVIACRASAAEPRFLRPVWTMARATGGMLLLEN